MFKEQEERRSSIRRRPTPSVPVPPSRVFNNPSHHPKSTTEGKMRISVQGHAAHSFSFFVCFVNEARRKMHKTYTRTNTYRARLWIDVRPYTTQTPLRWIVHETCTRHDGNLPGTSKTSPSNNTAYILTTHKKREEGCLAQEAPSPSFGLPWQRTHGAAGGAVLTARSRPGPLEGGLKDRHSPDKVRIELDLHRPIYRSEEGRGCACL